MSINKRTTLAAIAVAMIFASCKNSEYEGYETTESGLHYQFYNDKDEDAPKPKIGEHAMISFKIRLTANDSVIEDSKNADPDGDGQVQVPIQEPTFKGGLEEGLTMMSPGDSASFIISADSFLLKTNQMREMPPFIKPGSMLTFDIKMHSIKDEKAVKEEREKAMAQQQQQMEEYQKMADEAKGKEGEIIENYIKENKITAKPTESGLYYIETRKGKGPKVQMGDSTTVKYTLYLLDGTMIESNTFTFPIGEPGMIPGWTEGIGKMNEGGAATLIMPSSIAYGPRGGTAIPPYTPLRFDVEVIETKPGKK